MMNTGTISACHTGTAHANSRSRGMHREMAAAVMRAYGWDDLDLRHGYHEQPNLAKHDRIPFTISDAARAEVLRRFVELSRQRYEEQQSVAPTRATAAPASQGAVLVEAPATTLETKAAAPAEKASTKRTR